MAYQFVISNPISLVLFTAAAVTLSFWIYPRKPKNETAGGRWQCTLSDVLILVWQLGLTGVLVFRPDEELGVGMELSGLAVIWAMIVLGWVLTLRWLSRSSVEARLLRLLMLGVVSPVVFCWPTVALLGLCFMLSGLPAVVLACLLYGCARLVRWVAEGAAQQRKPERRTVRRLIGIGAVVLSLLTPAVITLPACTYYLSGPVYYKAHLRRFRQRVLQDADLAGMQRWVESAEFSSVKTAYKDKTIPVAQCPAPVQAMSPTYVDPTPEGWLLLSWGSGFGHWGLAVAPKGTPTPPSSASGRDGEYILPIQDGIWVWIELQ